MLRHLARLIALISILFGLSAFGAQAEKRVALVIGNSAYLHAPALPNPANDAAAMAALFKRAGFDVIEAQSNVGIRDFRRAVRDFADVVRDADLAVVYYAGHGIEVDGTNYLVPTDARLTSDFDVEDETLSLDRVLRALEPAKRLRLVILDACRDNPFSKTMKRRTGTRAVARGLARVEPVTADMLVAFAAKAGSIAEDGRTANSPFTTALLRHLAAPGLDIRLALGRVRDEVIKETRGKQEPFVYGSLGGSTVALVPVPADPNAEARRDYEFAAQIGTKQAWQSFLAAHAAGLYAELARAQLAKLDTAEQASADAEQARRKAEQEQARRMEEARGQAAGQAKRQLEEARRQLEEAKRQADEARRQVEEVKRLAVEEARRQVEEARREAQRTAVAVAPSTARVDPKPAAAAIDAGDVARLLQAHLQRVGCDPGTTDGTWGDSSRRALDRFNRNAGTKFDVQLAGLDALDAVRAKTSRVCPLVCAHGQRVEGERCVAVTCGPGETLKDGNCQKTKAAPKTVGRPPPPAAAGAGARCFTFQGKRFCE